MYSNLLQIVPLEYIKFNEPMENHTSFKIGGPVDIMIEPDNTQLIKDIIDCCKVNEYPLFIFGLGSNLLVTDKGIRGVAIKLGNKLNNISINENEITAQAGVRLSVLAKQAAQKELTGLEFADGIPGSLGGAIVMNAGAYDGEMKNVLKTVTAISLDGKIKEFTLDNMEMDYRKSIFQKNGYYILSATLKLKFGEKAEILAKMQEFARRRRAKQPLEFPSAGSAFKRPAGHYVGPMIEKLDLKGFTIGGAQVSTKHAGFIINTGNATAQDVLELITYIQEKVKTKYNVNLEPELRIVGE
ncbi:MAG TPA: UDP-N-acetylmuramate dehydrogenase [Syntrophomonadaceae bacterium]|nr:UDP-N-acetylmuramate dehydrogenase [Syntrophomonadaceae bacterium]